MKTPEQATIVVNCLTEIFKKLNEGGKENV